MGQIDVICQMLALFLFARGGSTTLILSDSTRLLAAGPPRLGLGRTPWALENRFLILLKAQGRGDLQKNADAQVLQLCSNPRFTW